MPIGARGRQSWTGFAALDTDHEGGSSLVFREWNDRLDWTLDLPLFGNGAYRLTPLAGQGSAELTGGRLSVHIPRALQYLWVRVK